MPLQHKNILNPITALEFCRNGSFILAGEGSYLKVYDAESSKLLQQCEIFSNQTIHGIACQDASQDERSLAVVVWGSQYMVTISNVALKQLLNEDIQSLTNTAITGPDWIMDVALSSENTNKFALITAHNTVLQAKYNSGTVVLDTPSSPSRSILYSAHLIWDSPTTLLVAAGTVFGEIITWRCNTAGLSEVLHTFTGHEGSIFGVNISQPITFPDQTTGRLLASCSDDRTIRVWKLAPETTETQLRDNKLMRETGFDDSPAKAAGCGLVATIMGHASRIWGVKIVIRRTDQDSLDLVNVLSFGEDSTTQYWALDFGSTHSETSASLSQSAEKPVNIAKLVHREIFKFHGGKHIFSSAVLCTSKQEIKVITGGADSKISMYNLEFETFDNVNGNPVSWDLQDIIQSCYPDSNIAEDQIPVDLPVEQSPTIDPTTGKPAKKPKAKKIPRDALNCYGFLTENRFILTTNFGRVFTGTIGNRLQWQELLLPDESLLGLKSYALVTGFPELGLAFLAGADGKIYTYQNGSHLRQVANLGRKIADMFKIYNKASNSYQLLVTVLGSQVATLLDIEASSPSLLSLQSKDEYQLPEKFVVTSAGRINDLLLLGSRVGSLALYSKTEAPSFIWTRPLDSPPESITTIISIPSDEVSSYVLTTDRDGNFTIFLYTPAQSQDDQAITSALLTPVHVGNPSFGPMVENAWFSEPDNDLILYGFRSKSFVVWNHTRQYEISNVDCGGAHRSYAYSPQSPSGGGHFVYTKGSKLHIHTQSSLSHDIVKRGGHGREIKASAVSSDQRYIATGAEDTEIRLWTYDSSLSENARETLSCKAVVQKHTAGIQHLKFHNNYLLSSGGYEEFFIFAISQIPNFGVGIVYEASNPEYTPDRDLRIMSFDVCDYPGSEREETLLISLAFSDSTFKSYAYSKANGFTLVGKGRYTSSCSMQINHLSVRDGEVYLLTAATDGRLMLWKHTLPLPSSFPASSPTPITQVSNLKIHQSSIKALDLTQSRDRKQTLIVTGGDDNAIAVTVYNNSDLSMLPKSFILRSAHAAAVTAISFIPSPPKIIDSTTVPEERFVFASSSNDQRVKQWEVILTLNHEVGTEEQVYLAIKQIGDAFTAVADVGDLSVLCCEGRDKVLVVGNGMEVWDVSC